MSSASSSIMFYLLLVAPLTSMPTGEGKKTHTHQGSPFAQTQRWTGGAGGAFLLFFSDFHQYGPCHLPMAEAVPLWVPQAKSYTEPKWLDHPKLGVEIKTVCKMCSL